MPATYDDTSDARWTDAGVRPQSLRRRPRERTSIVGGALWMIAISLALFFLPAINGLIAGIVGGYKIGSVGRALIAALVPAVVVAFLVWLTFVAFDVALLGFLAGAAVGILILFADLGLFIGAVIGGLLGRRPELPEARARGG